MLLKNWDRERRNWWRIVLQLRSSVLLNILPRVIGCSLFGFLISLLDSFGINVSLPILSTIFPSIVLGLLLVFRTNTAYERFWEGRKMWGSLVNTVRNFARTIWVSIEENEAKDRQEKIATLRLLIAFAVATKLHLREEKVNSELEVLMPRQWFEKLREMNNPPLEVAFWIGDYLQQQYDRQCINVIQLTSMLKFLDIMVDVLGACERIKKTPIPIAYSIHLKQLLLIYCLTLPFQVIDEVHWWTGIIVGIIAFTVFGIEEIGIQIENPFGYDPNDLPLDDICKTMEVNIHDLITLAPCVRHWKQI